MINMSKKIITFSIVCIFLLTSITSSITVANNSYIKNRNLNTIELTNLESLKNLQEIGGGYSFSPCYINITGQGNADSIPYGLVWIVENGQININDFSRDYSLDIMTATGFFIGFQGNISLNPLEISGIALFGCLIENSNLVNVTAKKETYNRKENIIVDITNIGDANIEISNPHFYVLNNDSEIIFEDIVEDMPIEPGESKTWSWNQKNQTGDIAPKGSYIVIGNFSINNRIHVAGVEFILTGKKARLVNIQFLKQMIESFPILRLLLQHFLTL
jgi:hypothetical protein